MKPRWDTITTIALFGRNFPSVKKGFRTPLGIIESQVYPANKNKNAQLNLIITFYHSSCIAGLEARHEISMPGILTIKMKPDFVLCSVHHASGFPGIYFLFKFYKRKTPLGN